MSFGFYVLSCIVVIILVFGFALIKERYSESFAKAFEFIKNNKTAAIIVLAIIIIAVISIIFGINNSNKKTAIKEIEAKIEANIDKAYEGKYAQEYGLKSIEYTVDDVGKYLSGRYACVTIKCEIEKDTYIGYKEYLCKEILRVLPTSVSTSTYGDVAITSIIYTPSNKNIDYGVSIYVNGEQILKHNKTFDELEDDSRRHEKYKKEKEAESKYYAYSEFYEAKDYVENNW